MTENEDMLGEEKRVLVVPGKERLVIIFDKV